jgi:amino acid adenylation domain-containing protein
MTRTVPAGLRTRSLDVPGLSAAESLAAFQVVVSRWSGQRDLVAAGVLDGVYVPLPSRISSVLTFSELVGRLGEAAGEVEPDLLLDGSELSYREDRFDPDMIDSMVAAFVRVCLQVAADPSVPLYRLDALAPGQWEDLVHVRNATTIDYEAAGSCVHQLIEARADECPHRIAVDCDGRTLTYRELDTEANRLAHHLIALGVGPETPVCVMLDRSLELLVALLGVLKAGGCYVPLEPSYPADRLSFMAGQTAAPVLLTRSDLAANAPARAWTVVRMDTDRIADNPGRPVSRATPDNLAYVIFTSGSTGQPKGVMVPHRGVVHYLSWCGWAYQAGEGSGAPVHSPLSFDLTVTGLFLPLMYGRTVTMVPADEHPVVGLATRLGEKADFSFVKLTPGHLNVLAQTLPDPLETSAAAARWLVVGGEQLNAEHLALWREYAPQTMIVNEYGPTEMSVACVMECAPAGEVTSSPVPIGRPIGNTQVYVVDEELNLLGPGVPGELLLGGIGITRGYWGRPRLTAERFVPNPFGPGRLYRTGDVVRYLPDGRLEYIARIDRQVKVRGYRVELGEIESRLTEFPGIRQAVVLLRADNHGTPRLTAYVESGRDVSKKELQAFVKDRLPDFMVPEKVITLPEFPLTPNAKIDHVRLATL